MPELGNPTVDETFLLQKPSARLSFSSPLIQTLLLSFVFFLNFTAYDTIQVYAQKLYAKSLGTDMTMIIYVFFTLGCFGAPVIVTKLGSKWAMFVGILGYTSVVVAGLIYFVSNGYSNWLVLSAAGLLGLGASLLWTGQGQFLLQISTDENRGRFFAIFWALYRSASIIGGILSFTYFSIDGDDANSVPLYFIFLGLMLCAAISTLLLRTNEPGMIDATRSHESHHPPLCSIFETLLSSEMLCFAMLFWSTGTNEPYALSTFTRYFNKATTGAEMIIFYTGCVIGASLMGSFLDCLAKRNDGNSKCGVSIPALLLCSVFHFAAFILAGCVELDPTWPTGMSLDHPKVIVPSAAFALWGLSDAMINTFLYWRIGRTQSDNLKMASAVGLFKALNSAGHIFSYSIAPLNRVSGFVQLLLNVIFFGLGVILAFGRIIYRFQKAKLKRPE